MDQTIYTDGTAAVSLIRNGTWTCEQVVRATLAHIDSRTASILAWAYINPELVLARAKELDAIPLEARGALHGLMVGVKDIILTEDLPTMNGSPLCQDAKPSVDASVVALLRHAGAVIVGKTATTEFAAYKRATRTRNPHDITRTPGGSSSGSAAAVADFQCHVALGSQTAGSTIRPGSFCGLYSFKPTWASVSHAGITPFSVSNDTIGFFSRSIADLQLLAQAVHLADDDFVPSSPTRPLRIGICKTSTWSLAEEPTISSLELAESLLVAAGAIVTHVVLPPSFDDLIPLQTIIMSSEARASCLHPHLLATSRPPAAEPWIDEGLSKLVLDRSISRKSLTQAYDHIASLRPLADAIIGQYDALLCPSAPGVAPKLEDGTGDPTFAKGWTILHCPVVNVPSRRAAGELPVGLSLVGARYGDSKLLEVAARVDAVFRGKA